MRVQRTLPPSAAPIDWRDLVEGLVGLVRPHVAMQRLQAEFRAHFGVKHVWFVSSGKAALTLILRALQALSGRSQVVVPGYTCFSVPSAVVRAGLSVRLCDMNPETFDFDFSRLAEAADSEVLCVLATHLLGIGVDVPRVAGICHPQGIFVVEDVAQAFGGERDGKPFGSMGDVSFLSFGRGKNITCGSGGAILTNDDRIGEALTREYAQLPDESLAGQIKNWLEVAVTQLLINPSRFWFPAGLPFLKLGETKFYTDFSITRMDSVRAGLLRRWQKRLSCSMASRMDHAEQLRRSVPSHVQTVTPSGRGQSVYLRFPLLMRSKQEKDALCRKSAEQGLGISALYPCAVNQIKELSGTRSSQQVPESTMIAERLVTLPTHEFVSNGDLVRLCAALDSVQENQGLDVNHVLEAPGVERRAQELPRAH
ncbi:MAG: DegT/DnrJ/EryC1/StrS family aminotransferase [Nitrospira sp.]|nr:DegT/DnrJ/EryC1/StrS family aminotransferase [Nitrospira sp.]